MSGMAEILDENTRLRELNRQKDARIDALLAAQADTSAKMDVLVAEIERLTKHFEFLEKKQELAKAERFIASEQQVQLFADSPVELPPRDATVQRADEDRPTGDKRKSAKHKRKGRRDLSELDLPKRIVHAPLTPSACGNCGGQREPVEPRITHRLCWVPGHYEVLETHQHQCACPSCPSDGVWTAPEPFLLPRSMCDDGLLAQVIGDHLPLNQQAARMKRSGFPIGSTVLSGSPRGPRLRRLPRGGRRSEELAVLPIGGRR